MDGMFPKFWAVFAQFEFFSPRLFSDSVVIFTSFFADEEDSLCFLFTFFASHIRILEILTTIQSPHYNPRVLLDKPRVIVAVEVRSCVVWHRSWTLVYWTVDRDNGQTD